MDKRARLLDLAKRRQATRWEGYGCLGDYQQGAYECDEVSPYSKTAGNHNASIFVMLHDWASADQLLGPLDSDAVRLGYTRNQATNTNLEKLLLDTFNLRLEDVYGTNLFPFIKPGLVTARIPPRDLVRAALEFALPQIQIVEPKIVICLGLATFNALRRTCAETQCHPLDQAIGSPFALGLARVWCQAHTGVLGRNNRNRGGVDRVSADWRRMKSMGSFDS